MKTNLSLQRAEKINKLIEAALKRYSHEELFVEFLETITNWGDRESIAKATVTDELLLDDILEELWHKVTGDQLEKMQSILEVNGYKIFKCNSLAEELRLEQFEQELTTNPYQLNLV